MFVAFAISGATFAPGSPVRAQDVLPFPPTPSASIAGRTMQESVYHRRVEPRRLPADAPNILIVLIDDAGPGLPSTYGGRSDTPTLDRIAKEGISYNRFHTTAMCSPTRASLLTGRNHHRVGNGQIAELANDWDGYSGTIPKSSATVAEVLKDYGYSTAAWGKWHNTPAEQTTAAGPFDYWPTGYGFEYFYGFLAGEASQYEPNLVRNTTVVPPPKTPAQRLSPERGPRRRRHRLAAKAQSLRSPINRSSCTGPAGFHGPHHIMKEWADKYKGKFDDGWDKYRERVFGAPRTMGWIPAEAATHAAARVAGRPGNHPREREAISAPADGGVRGLRRARGHQVGRVVDEIDRLGYGDNTLIFYIWGDNGSSAEGQNGTISELLAQNGIPTTIPKHIKALDSTRRPRCAGFAQDRQHVSRRLGLGWQHALQGHKTRRLALRRHPQPMAVRWPAKIKPDATPRSQFHHVNDVVPTIYEIVGITPPRVVNGVPQDPIDGVSFACTFDDAKAKDVKQTQYFEIMGSRGIYHDGWIAVPSARASPGLPGFREDIRQWTPDNDKWELYNLDEDWSQANDLAAKMPDKLAQMRELFAIEVARNNGFPVGGGLWVPVVAPRVANLDPLHGVDFRGRHDADA